MFGGFCGDVEDLKIFGLRINAQGGDDAGGEAQCTQICGGEGRSHAFVICGCIGKNFSSTLQMHIAAA